MLLILSASHANENYPRYTENYIKSINLTKNNIERINFRMGNSIRIPMVDFANETIRTVQ